MWVMWVYNFDRKWVVIESSTTMKHSDQPVLGCIMAQEALRSTKISLLCFFLVLRSIKMRQDSLAIRSIVSAQRRLGPCTTDVVMLVTCTAAKTAGPVAVMKISDFNHQTRNCTFVWHKMQLKLVRARCCCTWCWWICTIFFHGLAVHGEG